MMPNYNQKTLIHCLDYAHFGIILFLSLKLLIAQSPSDCFVQSPVIGRVLNPELNLVWVSCNVKMWISSKQLYSSVNMNFAV